MRTEEEFKIWLIASEIIIPLITGIGIYFIFFYKKKNKDDDPR